ncbi:glycoside hydrolase family 15 protein [Streptomyces sp. AP-93]|uniref:glycoside hydrolase family 15 protein n=1 Tax=Streptomyces sp. AP-93 TaxID=2929048 RepID=UPI001FAF8B3A|nr:glycoside hydrolase family 15 protein [Streptomyces sp. AP-93]MCJ0872530.1 glycoside hydrolase family 15 protein [Streptomyces sp. AP-93]
MPARIEDYALIGDMQTAALVARDGSLDWMCLPRFDSAAVFAHLLGTEDNGLWRIGPAHPSHRPAPAATRRRYRPDTLSLESEWDTPTGEVRVTDLMPPRDGAPQTIRIVEGLAGTVTMRSTLRMRFGYGLVVPWVDATTNGRLRSVAGPDSLWLDTDAPTYGEEQTTYADFTVRAGQRVTFALSWQPSDQDPPPIPDAAEAMESTEKFWQQWSSHCTYQGPHREAVMRSLITLKALTYAPTGGIVAAPTTSLPEEIGGSRNWDYRYTWLRDAAITLSTLLRTGYREEARDWCAWLLRAVAGDPENLQIMYGIAGERSLGETELDWLPGYENSAPVRVGNGAAHQLQLDVYGELAMALHAARQAGLAASETAAHLQIKLCAYLETIWERPDEGIWEIRGPRRHFVHSKVMAWAAVDRTILLVESGGATVEPGVLERWRTLRDTIHHQVCTSGYDPVRNTFTQSYGSTVLDASLLLIPQTGFLPSDDPRVIGTIEAVQRDLCTPDGLLLRYPTAGTAPGRDGLQGDEGAFLACSFWLVDALLMLDRTDEAHLLLEKLLALRSDVGLLAEEWDSTTQRQVGNFPQAFSHVALCDSAARAASVAGSRGSAR